jgi:hypothetical protein
MKISDILSNLSHDERIRTMARLEGMTLAMRIIGNRASDLRDMAASAGEAESKSKLLQAESELLTANSMIRLVQVSIGNGTQKFGDLSASEIDSIMRIY